MCVQVQEQWQFTICIMYVVGIHDFTMRRYWLIVVAAAVAAGSSRATDPQTYLPMLYYAPIYIVLPLSLCFNARTHRVSASRNTLVYVVLGRFTCGPDCNPDAASWIFHSSLHHRELKVTACRATRAVILRQISKNLCLCLCIYARIFVSAGLASG